MTLPPGASMSSAPLSSFHVRLKVGKREFVGEGASAQMSKHDAASRALEALKEEQLKESASKLVSTTSLNPASLPFVPGHPVAAPVGAPKPVTSSSAAGDSGSAGRTPLAFKTDSAAAGSSDDDSDFDDLKSPISLVHESALKRNLTVSFEVLRESGPPHMRTFVTKCSVGEDFQTEGEGNGKKVR